MPDTVWAYIPNGECPACGQKILTIEKPSDPKHVPYLYCMNHDCKFFNIKIRPIDILTHFR